MDLTYSFMIPLLENLVQATHSYGWAIVALTVIIRLLMWPLVSKQTESMQKMSKISPIMKQIQEKYKDQPEILQQKLADLMMKNRANPVGGCLPMLIQFPIFIALFATFSGPPFGDKPIEAWVHVIDKPGMERKVKKETTNGELPYVGRDGKVAKVTVFPGEVEIRPGEEVDFGSRAVDGKLSSDFKPTWELYKDNKKVGEEVATINKETGHAVFQKPGDYKIIAMIHGVAKNETFGFINGLGKVATGAKLLKPENFDALLLIIGFGVTMHFSSKLNTGMSAKKDEPLDEQQKVMQDSMKFMPIVLTGTFVFIPLPVGVLVYMVVSNLIQTGQTFILMRRPAPPIINPLDEELGEGPQPKKKSKAKQANVPVSGNNGKNGNHAPEANEPKTTAGAHSKNVGSNSNTAKSSKTKRRTKKKKKK